MPFDAPESVPFEATLPSTPAEVFPDFAAAMATLDATDRANQVDGLAACREMFQTLPAIRRGDTVLLAHYDTDRMFAGEEFMWEMAEAGQGQPVKMAEELDEMRTGTAGELYFEAALLADGAGADLLALFQAIREIVSGGA